MAVSYEILDDLRLVIVKASGKVDATQMSFYENAVWRDNRKYCGYDELCDLTNAESFGLESMEELRSFAAFAAGMDLPGVSRRLAIVAPSDISFGLARMYQSYRELSGSDSVEIGVFRELSEAHKWLGK